MTEDTAVKPAALVGFTAPAFISDWFESWWLRLPSKGAPVIGTALLIGAATISGDKCCSMSSADWEAEVRDFAQLAVARMVGQDDQVLAIGMEKTAPAREIGATVVIPRIRHPEIQNLSLILANRPQALKLPWLSGSLGPDSRGLIAGSKGNAGLSAVAAGWPAGGEDTGTIVQHIAEQERNGSSNGLQSLSVWAYKGGYEWGSLVVGCPCADSKSVRALLVNTARELGVTLFGCGDALDLLIEQTERATKGPQPMPEHWRRLN